MDKGTHSCGLFHLTDANRSEGQCWFLKKKQNMLIKLDAVEVFKIISC